MIEDREEGGGIRCLRGVFKFKRKSILWNYILLGLLLGLIKSDMESKASRGQGFCPLKLKSHKALVNIS